MSVRDFFLYSPWTYAKTFVCWKNWEQINLLLRFSDLYFIWRLDSSFENHTLHRWITIKTARRFCIILPRGNTIINILKKTVHMYYNLLVTFIHIISPIHTKLWFKKTDTQFTLYLHYHCDFTIMCLANSYHLERLE